MADSDQRRVYSLRVPEKTLLPPLPGQGRNETFLSYLSKAEGPSSADAASTQGIPEGLKQHPFNMKAASEFKVYNIHHSTCINTKVASTVGLGFSSDKPNSVLNPLCMASLQDLLNDVAEDYHNTANGYIEVVRDSGEIKALYHAYSPNVYVVTEPDGYNFHYRQVESGGVNGRVFARFGDLDDLTRRSQAAGNNIEIGDQEKISEMIHVRDFAASSKWYGIPSWLAAVANIELVQCMTQHTFDFYLNRGVPEFMLFITGGQVGDADWKAIESHMQAQIGLGNSHKSLALNLTNPEIKVQVEKLAMDVKNDTAFGDLNDALALNIVSAHQVPPLLAGIQIPGKLGATNELPNALMAFQILKIGPAQNNIQQILAKTLGSTEAGLGLSESDFKFKTITDEMDLNAMATVGGMRQSLPEAKAEGRNLDSGMKN